MSKSTFESDEPLAEINVVPLVDIVLVVLIIFMVTAPMIMKPSIAVNLPKAQSGDKSEESPLQLTLDREGSVYLNGNKVQVEALRVRIEEEYKKNPEIQAVISADKDLSHGKVVAILDLIKSLGVRKLALSIETSMGVSQ